MTGGRDGDDLSGEEKVVPGQEVIRLWAVGLVVVVCLAAIWGLKSTVQTESANIVNACSNAAAQIAGVSDHGAQK